MSGTTMNREDASRPHTRSRALLRIALAVLLALTPNRVSAQSQDVIRVAASLSLTGQFRGPSLMMKDAYELWADEVNRDGGILGRPVELTIVDDESSPERVAAAYRRFVASGVDVVLSPYGTPNTLAAAAETEEAGYVLIAAASASDAVWSKGYERVFGTYSLARRYFIGFLDLLARQGYRSVVIVHESNDFNQDAAEGAARWAVSFGLDVRAMLSLGQVGIAEAVRRVGDADGLVVAAYPDAGYAIVEEMKEAEIKLPGLAMTIIPVHPQFYDRVGPYAEGVFAPSQWEPDERIPYPGAARFVEAFTAKAGVAPSYHAGAAYAACQVLQMAIVSAGGIDHTRMASHIASLDTVTIIGRFKTDATGRQVGHNSIIIQWQDGRKEIVYPRSLRTAPARFPE